MELFITILENTSVLIGIWVAIYGINSWRAEFRGKRKIELAEDTLTLFYEARDAIAHIRHPASYSSETSEVERGENEPEVAYEARKNASIVFVRYKQHSEVFNNLHAMRYRFMAVVGKEESVPFEKLRNIENEIFRAARTLARLWVRERFYNEAAQTKHLEKIQYLEDIFWGTGGEHDPIEPKVNQVIAEIEEACFKVINEQKSLHYFLTKPLFQSASK